MKKLTTAVFVVSLIVLGGCSQEVKEETNPQTTPNTTQTESSQVLPESQALRPFTQTEISTSSEKWAEADPSYIYPSRDAQVGKTYGEMTLKKISKKPTREQKDMYAYFQGNVTLSGTYEFMPEEEAMGLSGNICFTVSDRKDIQKLPQSKALYSERDTGKFFCFSNHEEAKKLLKNGKGKATIVISSLNDIIDTEGEVFSTAAIEKVLTKTEEKL